MMALFKTTTLINRTLLRSTVNQCASLTTLKIKLDGKPVNIEDLPEKPKSLNLFKMYCFDLGLTEDQTRNQREKLVKQYIENKKSFLDKNKALVNEYKNELKTYNEVWKKPVTLEDVQQLIRFCKKKLEKEKIKKSRKMSFFNFFVKQAVKEGVGKSLNDLVPKYKSLSSSERERYEKLYDGYLKSLN